MTAWASNSYTLAFGLQSAKGTPASAASYKLKVVEGAMTPSRQTIKLAETDGSRQAGKTVVVGARVGGAPRFYLRPSDIGLIDYALLGANADSGSAGAYVHDATQANSLPYLTVWESFGNVVVTKYVDCQIIGGHFAGQSGGAITAGLDIVGLTAVFGATDDVSIAVSEDPFVYPDMVTTRGGVAPGTVDSWMLDITNGGDYLQGDLGITPNRYVIGKLDVSGTIVMLAEDDHDFRAFHAGATGGTSFSRTLFTESMDIKAAKSGTLYWKAHLASVAYTDYPLAPDPSGAPTMVAMKFESQPDNTTPGNYVKLTAANAVATYA